MLKWMMLGLQLLALNLRHPRGFGGLRATGKRGALVLARKSDPLVVAVSARNYLLYFMMPFWILPGLADYGFHRKTDIAHTSGTKESVIHAVMMSLTGTAILIGLLLEVNALTLLLMVAAAITHFAVAHWDVSYANRHREVPPWEQNTHSFLEVLPFTALSFMVCLYPRQFAALFGLGPEAPQWVLRWKQPGLPARYLAGLLSAIGVLVVLPYAEELLRCMRAGQVSRPRVFAGDAATQEAPLAARESGSAARLIGAGL